MNRNVKILLFISILFGLSLGIYEFVLPFYLKDRGISFANMGIIFSLSSVAMFFIRIHAGQLSDIHGRKIFYSLAVLGSGIANFFTPFTAAISNLTILKSIREAGSVVQESIHAVSLFEISKKKFLDFIAKTNGAQWVFQGLGAMVGGILLLWFGYRNTFLFNAVLLFFAFVLFSLFFREPEKQQTNKESISILELYAPVFSPQLLIITIASFMFMIGMGCSHSFVMPLFFTDKFGVSRQAASIIMTIHRLVLGIPMIFAARFIKEGMNLKRLYIWFVFIEGLALSASALIPNFFLATIVWLAHDYIGCAFWGPVQKTLIQRYSRQESRALDVSKVAAFSTLGWIVGPIVAGYLSPLSISAPFFVSGVIMMASVLILVKL